MHAWPVTALQVTVGTGTRRCWEANDHKRVQIYVEVIAPVDIVLAVRTDQTTILLGSGSVS